MYCPAHTLCVVTYKEQCAMLSCTVLGQEKRQDCGEMKLSIIFVYIEQNPRAYVHYPTARGLFSKIFIDAICKFFLLGMPL